MIYLLAVNALLALAIADNEFHLRVLTWARHQRTLQLATCAITEIAFVRLARQITAYGFAVAHAQLVLRKLKSATYFRFIEDDHDATRLPSWGKSPRQIKDGHLVALAAAHGAKLATLDEGIANAYLIDIVSQQSERP